MKHEQRVRMYEQIRRHGENLLAAFPQAAQKDPIKLCKAVHRLEIKAAALALRYCNGGVHGLTVDQWEVEVRAIALSLDKILNFRASGVPVWINGDARGYALKIHSEYVAEKNLNIHRDMGGYGIIAPEFDGGAE